MSLVGDALRKARQQHASDTGDSRLGASVWAQPRARSRLGLGVILGLVAGGLVAVVSGLTVWWLIGSAATNGSSPPASAAEPVPGTGAIQQAPPVAAPAPEPAPPVAVHGGPLEVGPETVGEPEAVSPADDPPAVAMLPASPPPSAGGQEIHTQPPRQETADGDLDFVLTGTVGDLTLTLGYIIYRSEDPFAEVNDREVHVGSVVDGFEVTDIGKTSVTLEDGARTVVLRVR